MTDKDSLNMARSPVSVQDVYLPEIQPLHLPDSWTVVGKKGKPLKGKMYDEPLSPKKKKKKKKHTSKAEMPHEPLADLEEEPCSSKCHYMSERSNAKHFKEVSRGRDAKHWARYRENKQIQADALVVLHALLLADEDASALTDGDEKMQEQTTTAAPEKERRKSQKSSSQKQKVRRANRFAAAAARCYAFEDNEHTDVVINPSAKQKKQALDADVGDSKKRRSPSMAKEKSSDKRKATDWTEVDASKAAKPQPKASSSKAASSKASNKKCIVM